MICIDDLQSIVKLMVRYGFLSARLKSAMILSLDEIQDAGMQKENLQLTLSMSSSYIQPMSFLLFCSRSKKRHISTKSGEDGKMSDVRDSQPGYKIRRSGEGCVLQEAKPVFDSDSVSNNLRNCSPRAVWTLRELSGVLLSVIDCVASAASARADQYTLSVTSSL